ncbi:pyridoxine 5'-phosphate oxidase C-terminal domain-containing protein [Streptomyces sp. NPDC055992]|uniref:pyridoxine 5'-phosphate oxidase C-terminal domain-containing protein n=1 Tax=Streptomyces sp. NPDC055992 TaxID=3345673 RepID=UPI0035E0620C
MTARTRDIQCPGWRLCTPVPAATEFWQSDTDRLHRRLRYERVGRHAPRERHPLRPQHAVGHPGRQYPARLTDRPCRP